MNWKSFLIETGKFAASLILPRVAPGSANLVKVVVQLVESIYGTKTGAEKKDLACGILQLILSSMAKSGRIDSGAPATQDIAAAIQDAVDSMKISGELEEVGLLSVGGKRIEVTVRSVLP